MPQKKAKRKPLRKPDPIFEAMKAAKAAMKHWNRLYDGLQRSEWKARKTHGNRPWSLIAWRKYGAIGGGEIERARAEFLAEGLSRKLVLKEYQDAKARERKGERAERAWDRRAGITAQRRECDRASALDNRLHMTMAATKPTTPAGAAALLTYLRDDMQGGETEWHEIALDTIIATLPTWTLQAK